jgi:chromosome segregation ATPase
VDRNNWEEACKRHRESLNQLKTEHEQLLAEREQLMERVQECEEALQLKESDIADLNGAVEQLKSENQELMINLEQYQEENALLTEQLDEFEKLKSQQYLKESEIDQLTQQLREVQESAFVSSTMVSV